MKNGDGMEEEGGTEAWQRHGLFFCDLPTEALESLDEITQTSFQKPGAILFYQHQIALGIYIICTGRVRLTTSARSGKSMIRVFEPGEILGLGAAISGTAHESTAEVLDTSQINFVRNRDLVGFIRQHSEAGLRTAQHLSRDYFAVHELASMVALSDSVAEKLARLLLGWSNKNGNGDSQNACLRVTYTHGEIGQMIGSSRETVTRLLSDFRQKGLIHTAGTNLYIRNRQVLEKIAKV